MTRYGQFCPVSKATAIIGSKVLIRGMEDWFGLRAFADARPAE